jgi:hypothetical protein
MLMEISHTHPEKPDDDAQKPTSTEDLEHVSDLLVELWRDYKNSHLPNLIYSVAFVGGVLTLGNTSELFKRVSGDGKSLITIAVFLCMAAAGLAMMHRFTSQLFMEIETLPADRAMRNYFFRRNLTYKKITLSYGYSPSFIELFKFLHTITKYLTSVFLYIGWLLFGLSMILALLRPETCRPPAPRSPGDATASKINAEICGWSTSEYSYFLEWFVGGLAKKFPFGITFLLIVIVITGFTCWSLRQPNAYTNGKDRMGPIAWPSLMLSVVGAIALIFSYVKNIDIYGFAVHKNGVGCAFAVVALIILTIISCWQLKMRSENLKQEQEQEQEQEQGDLKVAHRKIKKPKNI